MNSHPIAKYTALVLGAAGEYAFEHRIFNAVMALVALTGVATIGYNILLGNHYLQNVVSLGCTLFPLFCFLHSKRRKQYKALVIPAAIYFYVVLCTGFFVTDGLSGSLPYFFFILIVYCVIFVERPFVFFVPFVLATIVAMAMVATAAGRTVTLASPVPLGDAPAVLLGASAELGLAQCLLCSRMEKFTCSGSIFCRQGAQPAELAEGLALE